MIAIINETDVVKKNEEMPRVAVTCFLGSMFDRLVEELGGNEIAHTKWQTLIC